MLRIALAINASTGEMPGAECREDTVRDSTNVSRCGSMTFSGDKIDVATVVDRTRRDCQLTGGRAE